MWLTKCLRFFSPGGTTTDIVPCEATFYRKLDRMEEKLDRMEEKLDKLLAGQDRVVVLGEPQEVTRAERDALAEPHLLSPSFMKLIPTAEKKSNG